MPQQRTDIRMIKDILRLKYSAALSHEAIARSLGIPSSTLGAGKLLIYRDRHCNPQTTS